MPPNEDMTENNSSVAAVGGDQLLSELGRMLKENAEFKQRNEALEEEVKRLRQGQPDAGQSSDTANNNDDENDTTSSIATKQPNNTSAALQDQILALQGKNQATQQILASTKAENETLLEKIVLLSAENMILKEQIKEGVVSVQPTESAISHSNTTQDALQETSSGSKDDGDPSDNDNELKKSAAIGETTATVEELQETIEHLQQRLMHQVEEKLMLQTQVETLEHLLVEEKGAFRSIIESTTLPPKPLPAQQATPRQADIIREALERKKSKNLRTRMSTKVYNSNDKKIDVQAYQQLYEDQLKQERLDQRIRKPPPPPSSTNHECKPVSATLKAASPSIPTIQSAPTLATDIMSPERSKGNGNDTTPLNKIGTQHITTRLWDFDDWEIGNNNETKKG